MNYSGVFVCFANFAFVFALTSTTEKGSVVFPTRRSNYFNENPVWKVTTLQSFNTSPPRLLPMSMIRRINSIDDEEEFIQQFVIDSAPPTSSALLRSSFVSRADEKKFPTPKAAKCQPELRTVNLMGDVRDPVLVYFPCCTRIERCGGCCTHPSLSCQPTKLEYNNFTINVYKYVGDQKLERVEEKVITLESHKKCKCNCAIKAQDCTSLQVYNEEECRCMCANTEEERECSRGSQMKLWNPSRCSCDCREGDMGQCGTGQIFDNNSCRCIPRKQSQPSFNANHNFNYNSYNSYS